MIYIQINYVIRIMYLTQINYFNNLKIYKKSLTYRFLRFGTIIAGAEAAT